MNEAIRRISTVYYSMYSGTILLAVVAYFLNANGITFIVAQNKSVMIFEILYFVSIATLAPYSFMQFIKSVKKCLQIEDNHEKFESYIRSAKTRLYIVGALLLTGVVLFYILRSSDLLYGIGITALGLIYSKPTFNKISSDLKLENLN